MERNNVIGLIGLPGAGKDLLAEFMVKYNDFKRVAFADQIKREYYKHSGFSERMFKNNRKTKLEQKIRKGLWEYSDKMKSQFGNLHFISPVMDFINNSKDSILITDIRTIEEKQELEKIGAHLVCIIREFNPIGEKKFVPGTRLQFRDIFGIPVFWNYSDDVSMLCEDFIIFCEKVLKIKGLNYEL